MAYRFKRKETVPGSVRRIVNEQTQQAARELAGDNPDIHDAVHNARKSFKKTRSLLRLIRSEIGEDVYQRENRWLRDGAHRLAGARDAEAMLETFDALAQRYPEIVGCEVLKNLRPWLLQHREQVVEQQQDLVRRARELAAELKHFPDRVDQWPLEHKGFKAIAPGHRRIYRRGRKAFQRALAQPVDDNFHAWRKRVKDYWYHTRLLRRTWPEVMETRVVELKRLSDLLGDDHDLAVMRGLLSREQAAIGTAAPLFACLAIQRQQELRAQAGPLGRRLYAADVDCAVDQLAGLWKTWKSATVQIKSVGARKNQTVPRSHL
jgi:CHAD domain-containing protein